ncbi:MAG: HemK2/MTQ2 family protein methyltransferase [Candidatus Thermoplasmatota archaeon]|nr:HemK2/MTQ2 family protein methyltransferase [Candidatus Thermoplasmatota archaeon]
MEIDTGIKVRVNDGVYPPSEDSYFLIQCINVGKERVLDMGTGTGIIALHAAKEGAVVTAVDKNEKAVKNAKENADNNGIKLTVRQSDLFSNVKESFDVIIFNPPHLPSDKTEEAWEGGKDGVEITEKFLGGASYHLNSGGKIYIILSTLGNIKKLIGEFKPYYQFEELGKLSLFFEKLVVYSVFPSGQNFYNDI